MIMIAILFFAGIFYPFLCFTIFSFNKKNTFTHWIIIKPEPKLMILQKQQKEKKLS